MRFRRVLVALLFGVAIAAATSPVWRVLLLGTQPTLDELMQLRCSAPGRP